ncbi:MAG: hypothetical protein ACFFED_00245 [Candidatus Thorarchaeota archaeon]
MIELIIAGLLVLFMGGMCFDWICSGSINPIYNNRAEHSEGEAVPSPLPYSKPLSKEGTIRLTCPMCRLNSEYNVEILKSQGHVKCRRCEHIFGQDTLIEID